MAFRVSETIRRPRRHVWAALTDWDKAPSWMKGVDELRRLDEGAVGEGTRLSFKARGTERETIIVAWEPGERLVLQSRQGGVTADYEYIFCDALDGTQVTLYAECSGEGVGWRLAMPLIRFLMARADSGQLRDFKAVVEDAAGSVLPDSDYRRTA
jgi:uncharacterized protein YndB with AHSA1/START domain